MAGPAANAILALLFVVLAKIVSFTGVFMVNPVGPNLYQFFGEMVWVNLLLAVFNLLPIPPLDGSTLVLSAIPDRYAAQKAIFVKYGALLLLVVILAGTVTSVNIFPIGRVIQWLSIHLYGIFGM